MADPERWVELPGDVPPPGESRVVEIEGRRLLVANAGGTPYAVLVMFILGAILTPPDVVSQVMLALPMIVLYLSGAAVAWVFDPQRRAEREAARAAKQAGSAVAKRDG